MDSLKLTGKKYGYPDCCIQDFWQLLRKNKHHTEDQKKVANNTGFIPCTVHTLMILEEIVKLPDLIKNRTHPKPFPHT